MVTASAELAPGTNVDRYVIDSVLGTGGMGTVYRARHALMGNPVALKVLQPSVSSDPHALERFLREAKASAVSGSPHIVRVLDFGFADGMAFLVMELLEGRELWDLMRTTGPLPPERAVAITLEILAGVGAAHAHGIAHRDLKPQNVFLAKNPDGTETAKILDFGISKILESATVEHLTRTGVLLGTPMYMAPEQFLGSRGIDHRADLYSVCVILYEMLSRNLPHDADTITGLIVAVTSQAPRPLPDVLPGVPRALAEIVHRGLEREPAKRWQSAQELAAALRSADLGAGATVGPVAAAPIPAPAAANPASIALMATAQVPVAPTPAAGGNPAFGASGAPGGHPAWGATPVGTAPIAPTFPGPPPAPLPAMAGPGLAPGAAAGSSSNTTKMVVMIVAGLVVLGCVTSCFACGALNALSGAAQ